MNKGLTEKQKHVSMIGKRGERKAKEWLEDKGFLIEEWFPLAHAGYYDIKATKDGEKWLIEVKTGETPSLNIANFLKMTNEKGVNVGLAVVTKGDVYLLEIKERTLAGKKSWRKREK